MAFKGRGSGGIRSGRGSSGPRIRGGRGRGIGFGIGRGYSHVRYCYYGSFSEYLIAEFFTMVLIAGIIGIAILSMIFKYESSSIYDPLEVVKNNFIDLQFGGLIFSGILLGIASTRRKTSKNAYKVFVGTFICLISVIIVTVCGYIGFTSKYNETTFGEMYSESLFKVPVVGESRELFVKECVDLTEKFNVKVATISIAQYLLVLVNIFFFISEMRLQDKYAKIEKENEVLFDEEINVKI